MGNQPWPQFQNGIRERSIADHIEHQPANYKLCFLSDEKLFRLIIDLIKTILAAFIGCLVRHPGKTKLNGEPTMYCSLHSNRFFRRPV